MEVSITDHGTWVGQPRYDIPVPEEALPYGNVVTEPVRTQDGVRWDDFTSDPEVFAPGSIMIRCIEQAQGSNIWLTQQIERSEENRVIPNGLPRFPLLLLEVHGVDPAEPKPHRLFEYQLYDRNTQTFHPLPKPVGDTPKLGLIRTLKDKGLWGAAKIAIMEDEDLREEWDAATTFKDTDPVITKIAAAVLYSTEEEIVALCNDARAAI